MNKCQHDWGKHEHFAECGECGETKTYPVIYDEWQAQGDRIKALENNNRRFPINRNGGTIPWEVAEEAYIEYCNQYGSSQSLERMGERGGFAISELDILHPKWRSHEQALERIKALEGELDKVLHIIRMKRLRGDRQLTQTAVIALDAWAKVRGKALQEDK